MSRHIGVLVSHPGKQGNVYQRPRAAEQAGFSTVFLTGLYYFPDRFPYSLVPYLWQPLRDHVQRELEKRRQEGLSPANVVSLLGPVLETTLRPMGLIKRWGDIHDRLASRWLQLHAAELDSSIVHCFQGSALRTLQAAGKAGATRILEVTLPPVPIEECPELATEDAAFMRSEADAAARLRRGLEECDWAVAQSAFSVKSITALGFPRERILAVPLGVDTELFKPRASRDQRGPKFRALFVGTICRRKGIHHLLRAWEELNLKDAELTLVGNCGTPEARRLLAQCPPGVCAIGNLSFERLMETYQSADILVHPSLAEGGCNAVHEALACGLPCVVTTHATSAVRDGREGYVVGVGSVDGLKERVARLQASQALRAAMSRAARQRAEELSWAAYVARLGAVYRDLARAKQARPSDADIDAAFGETQDARTGTTASATLRETK
jgi:glycosyltransferase involved in cell wall biosynthesis